MKKIILNLALLASLAYGTDRGSENVGTQASGSPACKKFVGEQGVPW